MNIKSLTLKNLLTDQVDGDKYFDLTAPVFTYIASNGVKALHYVLKDQEGRPDIISNIYYGGGSFVDAICITNNIFNPFSIKEGDILFIPEVGQEDRLWVRPKVVKRNKPAQAQYTDTGTQSQKDKSRIDRLKKKAKERPNGVDSPLPPNMLQPGQEAKTLRDGRIQLGTNLRVRNPNRYAGKLNRDNNTYDNRANDPT